MTRVRGGGVWNMHLTKAWSPWEVADCREHCGIQDVEPTSKNASPAQSATYRVSKYSKWRDFTIKDVIFLYNTTGFIPGSGSPKKVFYGVYIHMYTVLYSVHSAVHTIQFDIVFFYVSSFQRFGNLYVQHCCNQAFFQEGWALKKDKYRRKEATVVIAVFNSLPR